MTFLYYTLLTLLLTVAVLLILLILIQKGRGGGLSSAFGGGGGSTAFGAKTGDVLTWATSIVFGVFILLAVALDLLVGSQYKSPASSSSPLTPAPAGPVTINNPAPAPSAAPTTQAIIDALTAQGTKLQAATTKATGDLNTALQSATKP